MASNFLRNNINQSSWICVYQIPVLASWVGNLHDDDGGNMKWITRRSQEDALETGMWTRET